MTKKQLENKYGIKIVKDIDEYRIYTIDGCPWEKGLRTIKAIEIECKDWEEQLLSIKKNHNK